MISQQHNNEQYVTFVQWKTQLVQLNLANIENIVTF